MPVKFAVYQADNKEQVFISFLKPTAFASIFNSDGMKRIAEKLEKRNPMIIRKWLSDECKPCVVEHVIEGYDEVYRIMIELDDRLMWPGWPLIGKLHDPMK